MQRYLHKYPIFMHNIMLNRPFAYLLGLFALVEKSTTFGLFLQWGAMRCAGWFMSHA